MELWIVLSILFVAYVYVGYPFVLLLVTKGRKVEHPTHPYKGDVAILMVVCNEEAGLEKKLKNLIDLNFSSEKKIYVVNDASTDNTSEILNRYAPFVTTINSPSRKGKANGINMAMEVIDTEIVLMVDCRQEIEESALQHLSSWFEKSSEYGAVSGELMFKRDAGNSFSEGMDGYWRYEKFIRSSEAKFASVPGVTGALYMLRKAAFEPIPDDTLLDDVQIPMVAASKGYRVGYDDRAIAWDVPSTSMSREKQRKIRTLSGNYQLLMRFPFWILPKGHTIWWQFFSHKIARLMAPFVAISSLIPALILANDGHSVASAYIIMFISGLLVLPLSYVIPALNKIKMVKLITSFISLNWFCVLAFFHFASGIKSGSWKS